MTSVGIHHVTAGATSARGNVRFYTKELGLRLVKRTVNFDDPTTWHLYYGDATGQPGSVLTFFPWEGMPRGRHGTGQAEEIGFAVPKGSIAWWAERLSARNIQHDLPKKRFDESFIALKDPDGMLIEIVGTDWAGALPGHDNGDIPPEHAVRGFSGVSLWLADTEATAAVLTDVLGFKPAGEADGRQRFVAGDGGLGAVVDLRRVDWQRGAFAGGIVHHVAFRAEDDAAQEEMAKSLRSKGIGTTEQKDRNYFRSVYFREPGGVLFEIATDDPGFAIDEPVESLGQELRLPEWLEPKRQQIAAALPPLE
ncbi:ring-cleaving dioxygenase [Microbaculum marinum]|uniref:Ring-cleaving dioxygenase n=1 Tax=Microbaculum marinum TaxID=1764581 RepID=A0AAW9S2I5_9HYPH